MGDIRFDDDTVTGAGRELAHHPDAAHLSRHRLRRVANARDPGAILRTIVGLRPTLRADAAGPK